MSEEEGPPGKRRPSLEPGFLSGDDASFDDTPPEFLPSTPRRGPDLPPPEEPDDDTVGDDLADDDAWRAFAGSPGLPPPDAIRDEPPPPTPPPPGPAVAPPETPRVGPVRSDTSTDPETPVSSEPPPPESPPAERETPPAAREDAPGEPTRRRGLFRRRREVPPPEEPPPPADDRPSVRGLFGDEPLPRALQLDAEPAWSRDAPTPTVDSPPTEVPPPVPRVDSPPTEVPPTPTVDSRPAEVPPTPTVDSRPAEVPPTPTVDSRPTEETVVGTGEPRDEVFAAPDADEDFFAPPGGAEDELWRLPTPAPPPPPPPPPPDSGLVTPARWRADAADYDDHGWEEITAEFRAMASQEAEERREEHAAPPAPLAGYDELEEEAAAPAPPGPALPPGRNVVVALVTAAVLALVVLGTVALGRPWFVALIIILLVWCLVEFYTAARQARLRPAAAPALVGALVILLGTYRQGFEALGFGLAMVLVFTLLWFLLGVIRADPVANLGVTLLGVLYVIFLGSFAVQILYFPDWSGITLSYLALTVAADVGAYFVGSRFGRRRVLPRVSPHKSAEGLIGGGLLALAVGVAVIRAVHPFDVKSAVGLAVIVMIAAPLGDLIESMLKRAIGVKDLGSILPGHGGVLDRLDSMLVVAPAVYYFVRLVVY